MDRIHKKSALPDAADLLTGADARGAELLWERYEQQLPLCGFTSNGLNCRKCFQGPCRINPFGDEPSRGVCGADRDQIAMETVFQATLDGVLDSARAVQLLGIGGTDDEFPDIASTLPSVTVERLTAVKLLPVWRGDLFGAQNSFFSHKGFLAQSLRDLARLGLINYGFLCQAAAAFRRTGYAPEFQPEGINLLAVGQISTGLIQAVQHTARQRAEGTHVNLFVGGAHRSPLTLAPADHGSAELALGMNVDALIVAPNASWPGLEALAATYGVPVVLADGGRSSNQTASEAVDQALRHFRTAFKGRSARSLRPAGAAALPREEQLKQALHAGRIAGVVVLFGETNAKQTFFERTLALMETAVAEKVLILLGGDLGTQADMLGAELGRRLGLRLSDFAAELEPGGLRPVGAFGSAIELPRVIALLNSNARPSKGAPLRTLFVFPEFYRASTWAGAVSLLALGFTVQIGTRLPFWGSPWLADAMTKEFHKMTGGTLLASPALPEPRAQAEEAAVWFKAAGARTQI